MSISDGLLSNNVYAVLQDATGYLWLGSEGGLQRYDGSRFRTLLKDRVDQILPAGPDRVWIRSGKRLGLFNTKTFSFKEIAYEGYREVYNPTKIWLRTDASSAAFLILTGRSCQYFNEQLGKFSSKYNPFTLPDSLKLTDVVDDPARQRYWIIAQNGFGYWSKITRQFYTAANNIQNDPLLAADKTYGLAGCKLHIDKKGRYRIQQVQQTHAVFYSFSTAERRLTRTIPGLTAAENNSYSEIYGFKTLNDSTVAVYGLNYLRIQEGAFFRNLKAAPGDLNGIHFNAVSDVMQDKEGTRWMATDNGLYYTTGTQYPNTHITFSNEKQRTAISSLVEGAANTLWIGTWGSGLYTLKSGSNDPQPVRLFPVNDPDHFMKLIWALCEDKNGHLWIGCHEGRLARYHPQNRQAEWFRPRVFQNSAVRQVIKDAKGVLWIGLQDGRVFTYTPAPGPVSDASFRLQGRFEGAISKMVFIGGQQLWIAVNGKGIYVMDTGNGTLLRSMDLSYAQTSAIANIKDIVKVNDTLCLIAGERLGTVHPQTFKVSFDIPYGNGSTGTVFTLQPDGTRYCWLGASNGIFRLDLQTKELTRFSQQDGLITVHNNSYVPERSTVLRNGTFAFGGNQHLVLFNPGSYRHSIPPAPVTITGFQLNDRYLPQDSLEQLTSISIPYAQGVFSIEFASIHFAQRERLTYEYKLEGLDKGWTVLTTPTAVKYNFLPHGTYRFMVRVKNNFGQYAPGTTSLNLYIAPPFWKTPWFYLLVLACTAALLFYLHRLRVQKLLQVEKVRSRLARDLHDDMGSTLSTIHILSNMALQQSSFDEMRNKEYMSTISSSTSQMMEAMDDIVWSINPVNDPVAKIAARMKETAGAILEPQQIDYSFTIAPPVSELHLPMELRREVFLLFKEALNNIVKYARCTQVAVTLSRKGAGLELCIRDNGVGFQHPEPGTALRGNGLKNMQKRAAYMKGKLSILSRPGAGTSIILWVPIA
ncbi:MAG: hypothetical protein J7599_14685 [Niabella sp.]|nr:hypothetical protein [Niabella sp.]